MLIVDEMLIAIEAIQVCQSFTSASCNIRLRVRAILTMKDVRGLIEESRVEAPLHSSTALSLHSIKDQVLTHIQITHDHIPEGVVNKANIHTFEGAEEGLNKALAAYNNL